MYLKKELYELIQTDESIFDFIQESALDGLWYWDLENPENEWMNAKFWTVLGYNPNEMPHKSTAWKNIIHQKDLKVANENFNKHLENPNHPYDQVVRYTHKDGSTVWIRCRGMAIRDKKGKPVRMLGAHQDVSDIKKREQELIKAKEKAEESEQNLSITLHSIGDGVIATDRFGRIDRMNPVAIKLCGWHEDEIQGKPLSEVFNILNADTRAPVPNPVEKVIERGEIVGLANHTVLVAKDGREYQIADSAAPIKDKRGEITGVVLVFSDVTEKYKSEQLLEQSKERYRIISETMTDFAFSCIKEESGYVIDWIAGAVKKNTGYSVDHIKTKKCWRFMVHPDDDSLFVKHVLSLNPGEESECELRILDPKKATRWLSVNTICFADEKAFKHKIYGGCEDITERKRVEKQLQKAKNDLQAISDNMLDLVAVTDMKGNYQFAGYSHKILGYEVEHLIGKNVMDFVHPDDLPVVQAKFADFITNEKSTARATYRNRCADGSFLWFETFGTFISDDDGNPKGILFNTRDITQRRQAEEALHKSNKRLESLLEISQKVTSAIDQDMIMQMIVDNAIRLIGQDTGAIYLKSDDKSVRLSATTPELPNNFPDDLRNASLEHHPHLNKALRTGKLVLMADVLSAKLTSEEKKIVDLRKLRTIIYQPIVIRGNPIGALILSSVEVTRIFTPGDLKMLQAFANQAAHIIDNVRNYISLQKYTHELEQQIKQREKAEQELIVAKEKAEESDRLKSAFLQNMSHEIRTPLNGIIGFSELLNNLATDEEKRKHFTDIIIENGWQLTSIIDDIITISSLETGQEQLRTDKVDVNRLIGDQLARFAQQAEKKGLRLISGDLLAEDDAMVYADKARLGQIFNNLILNALKFTEHGEVVIGCRKQADQLMFYVRDTGIGIDKSQTDLIFERFAQADDGIRVKYGGTGLGLSICKGFVELMGGEIWVESEPGQGSTFWFSIPYKAVKDIKTDIPLKPENDVTAQAILVLVAEDGEYNYLYLESLLEIFAKTINLKVIHAVNGQQAVDICREQAVDLVLMDIKMPIMDGHMATKLIREFRPSLPIIAQTAYALKSEMQQYGAVFDEYITKPFSMEKLKQVLRRFVKAGK